jgi:hypothetical protein
MPFWKNSSLFSQGRKPPIVHLTAILLELKQRIKKNRFNEIEHDTSMDCQPARRLELPALARDSVGMCRLERYRDGLCKFDSRTALSLRW